jgi:hypothetical protein
MMRILKQKPHNKVERFRNSFDTWSMRCHKNTALLTECQDKFAVEKHYL